MSECCILEIICALAKQATYKEDEKIYFAHGK